MRSLYPVYSSPEWNQVNKKSQQKLRQVKDNGEFWMPWSSWWEIFTDMTICSYSPDYDSDGITDGLGECWFFIFSRSHSAEVTLFDLNESAIGPQYNYL